MDLYDFVGNDAIGQWDMLGLKWKIQRDKSKNWAEATPTDSQDTFEMLADQLRLVYEERTDWLKTDHGQRFVSDDEDAVTGCTYFVPNVMAVYTSKSGVGDGYLVFVTQLKRWATMAGDNYEEKDYRVIRHLWHASNSDFKALWKSDGIVAVAFAGHGSRYGFAAQKGSDVTVGPHEVSPPYKLQAIGAYSCYGASPVIGERLNADGTWDTSQWRDLISPNGTFVGYKGWANWISVLWVTVTQNPGYIPD